MNYSGHQCQNHIAKDVKCLPGVMGGQIEISKIIHNHMAQNRPLETSQYMNPHGLALQKPQSVNIILFLMNQNQRVKP